MTRMHRGIVFAGAALLVCAGARAANPNYTLCFSPAYAGWRNFPEPVVDGSVGSVEWSNAFSYTFNNGVIINGVNQPDVVLYALANDVPSDHLKLAFQVRNDDTLDDEDMIILAFDYGNMVSPRYGLITLQPNHQGAPGTYSNGSDPNRAQYSTSSTGAAESWSAPITAPGMSWTSVSTSGAGCGTVGQGGCSWNVEMNVSLTLANGPKRPAGIYLNVVRAQRSGIVVHGLDGTATQFPWPRDVYMDTDATNTPALASWGNSAVGSTATCHGVSLNPADISAQPLSNNKIQPGVPTTLTAQVHNTSIKGSDGTPQVAQQVKATFQVARFGSGTFSAFTPIATTPATDLDPDSVHGGPTAMQVVWGSPPPPGPGDDGHRCILVTLDSTSNDTTFTNRGEFHNMTIAQNSVFSGSPVINVKGLPPPKDGSTKQKIFLSAQAMPQFAYSDGSLQGIAPGALTAQLNWIFHVTRDMGGVIALGRRKFALQQPLPSYGFSIHAPQTAEFQKAFEERHTTLFRRLEFSPASLASPNLKQDVRTRMADRINRVLANDPEKPSEADWEAKVAVEPVKESGGRVYEVDVPVEGEMPLPTTVSYTKSGGTCQNCFCKCLQTKNTPAFAFLTAAMMAVVGAFAYRRRK